MTSSFMSVVLALGAMLIHGSDDPNFEWYKHLEVPGQPIGQAMMCCTIEDCHPVAVRTQGSHWEVWIDSKTFPDSATDGRVGHAPNDWVVVPEQAILHGKDNPIGEPVGCWYGGRLRCFVPGTQT